MHSGRRKESKILLSEPNIACVAGGFKGLAVYSEGNYGERNVKDA